MTVALGSVAESIRTDTSDPYNFNFTPAAAPQGVAVAVVHGVSATDHVVGITYGGVAMARVVRATDTATELGAAELWFLGSGIPSGLQTISVNLASGTSDDLHIVVITVTAAADTEIVDFDAISDNVANPSVTLQYGGRTCLSVAALYGGGAAPSSFTPNANCTTVHDHDLGAFYSEVIRQTTPGSADFAIGGTASSDDVAYVAMAISEVQAAPIAESAADGMDVGDAASALAELHSAVVDGAEASDAASATVIQGPSVAGVDVVVAADAASARAIHRPAAADGVESGDAGAARQAHRPAAADGAGASESAPAHRTTAAAASDAIVASDAAPPAGPAIHQDAGAEGVSVSDSASAHTIRRAGASDAARALDAVVGRLYLRPFAIEQVLSADGTSARQVHRLIVVDGVLTADGEPLPLRETRLRQYRTNNADRSTSGRGHQSTQSATQDYQSTQSQPGEFGS